MTKIAIVHMRYAPDATGTAPLVTQLAEDLAGFDFQVTVITSLPHYGRSDIHPAYREYKGFFHRSRENGVDLIRTPIYVPKDPGVFQRALNYLSYTINIIFAGLKIRKVDLVMAVNPPITTAFSAWVISLFYQAPMVLSIQDVWPECLIRVGQLQNPILIWFSEWLERFQYFLADKVVVLSNGMKENLLQKGVSEKKIEIIPNWADPDEVYPLPKNNSFYKTHELDNKFVVLFSGNHGYAAALDNILAAAKLLSDRPGILFLLAGDGSVKKEILEYAQREQLSNVRFLPTQPKQTWLEMIAAADIALVTLRKDLGGLNVPSKMYTLMSAAKPVICSTPERSEITRLLRKANCGFWVQPESPDDLAKIILKAKKHHGKLTDLGQNGRKYLTEHLIQSIQTQKYRRIIQNLIKH